MEQNRGREGIGSRGGLIQTEKEDEEGALWGLMTAIRLALMVSDRKQERRAVIFTEQSTY